LPKRQQLLDSLAIGASTLCLVHCLALPALLILAPALAAYLAIPEEFHLLALIVAVPTSLIALSTGYRRHGQRWPGAIIVPGLLLMLLGLVAASTIWAETAFTVTGAILLAVGHAINWRAARLIQMALATRRPDPTHA
jgi:hypothetical protein